jgi:sugar phosphate isomerase/epimerase
LFEWFILKIVIPTIFHTSPFTRRIPYIYVMTNAYIDRRSFIRTATAMGLGAAAMSLTHPTGKKKMPLSFSTLGCPDWDYDEILSFASKNQYQGIEIGVIARQIDLPSITIFNTPDKIRTARKKAEDLNLKIVNLGSSAAMHHPDGPDREKIMDEARRFIDLARALGCPYIRVYPNDFPKDVDKKTAMERMTRGLRSLGDHAKGSGVTVLLETHGDLLYAEDIVSLMKDVNHPEVGLIWDIVNMWSVTKEPPAVVYPKIASHIRHVHVKDYRMENGKMRQCFVGQGISPIFSGIDALRKAGYKGFYSFEWEKLWHPEIEEPDKALPYYVGVMRAYEDKYGV